MFFLRANKESSVVLDKILKRYGNASGQSINLTKSSITFSRKSPISLKIAVKSVLRIEKEGGVGKYLGLPEHFGRKKKDLFTSIVDRIKQKADSWSNRFLSHAGKLVMLKSILSPIPSFAMTCFKLPASLIKRIQSAVTRFLWDKNDGTRKIAWVTWSTMTKPKSLGGLRFRDFESFNDAFLAKLSWRILNNPTCLLSRTLLGKYCHEEAFLDCQPRNSTSHGWRGILIGRDLLKRNLGWTMGNGESINAWTDPWLSLQLQQRPYGPAKENDQDLCVADLFIPETREWNKEKIQLLFPQEEENILCIKPSLSGAPDKLIWLGSTSGNYMTKAGYYAAIAAEKADQEEHTLDTNTIDWKKLYGVSILHQK